MDQSATSSAQSTGERARVSEGVVFNVPTWDRLMQGFFPEEVAEHMRNARREGLLAMRAMIDARLKRMDDERVPRAANRRIEIKVE